MDVRPSQHWTPADRLNVARLIVDPKTNGGMDTGANVDTVAHNLPPDSPAWGAWVDGQAVFVVGLWPFDGKRGCLHVAGDRTLNHQQHVALVRAFLSCLDGVEVFTVTTCPALARLARSVGFMVTGELGGVYTLERAS